MLINPKQPIIRQIREGEYEYQADLYDAKVFFNDPQVDDYNHLMKIVKYDNELIFKMLNASPTNITVDKDNQLTYHNVFEGVDTVYTLYPDKVKEDIIINSPEAEHVFKFRVYESLPATMQDSGDIIYCDTDNENQQVFELPAPYATDTNNNTVDVEMIHEEGYYTYKVIPNENTVYPIVLDPTVTAITNSYIINFFASGSKYDKSESKTLYFEDNIPKPKSIEFSTCIDRKYAHAYYTGRVNIIIYDKNNRELEKIERTNDTNGTSYHNVDIPDEAHHIKFYCSALNATTNSSSSVGMTVACGIFGMGYDSEDNIFIKDYSNLSLIANKQQICTLTSINALQVADISKLSFFAEDPSCITIDSITINDQIVNKYNFSTKPNDKIKIALTSTKTQKVGYITFVKKVGTQEHQLLNVKEEIIYGGHELLPINENTIGVDNDQFNLEEYIANGGNSDINTKELIYANESSELPININVDTSLREHIPVYTRNNEVDSSFLIYKIFNSELANYIKILGCTISSDKSCNCTYIDYNDNNHPFTVSSKNKEYIFNDDGIESIWRNSEADEFTIIRVDDVTVDNLDANLELDFLVYSDTSITFEHERIVKVVNGDIYEVIDPNKANVSDNLIPLGKRDKILLQTDKTYYIKHDGSLAVGVFRDVNVTLLPMNEKISDKPIVELIENIYATEKPEIQTMEYIINGNGYQLLNVKEEIVLGGHELLLINENTIEAGNDQFNLEERIVSSGISEINTKELIYANESELLPMNENIIGVGNDQFNFEENIVNGGNPEINIKELIYVNESSELPININVDTSLRKGIPVYTKNNGVDSSLLISHAFDSELANYIKILGFTFSSSSICDCVYKDYNDNNHYFSTSYTKKTYISDSNGIKSFRENPINTSILLRVNDVTVEKFDANLEPDFLVYGVATIDFGHERIVKIVNGDIYEVIDPNNDGRGSDNLIPLGKRDKILLRTDKTYYIKHNESKAVGVFKYVNAAIENSLLPMNERIVDKSMYTTEKSEIQTMEYIIKGNGYQYINTKELIYANENSKLPININIDDSSRKGIPVYTRSKKDNSFLFVARAFDSELAKYVKILGCTVSSSKSCNCVYKDYNDNKYNFTVSSGEKKYISDSNGIKDFRGNPVNTSITLRAEDVTVDRLDTNFEPLFFVYSDTFMTFGKERIVKIVNGDIYEVIDPNKQDVPSNLIPLGRDKVLLQPDKFYYIRYKESYAIGVFEYNNVTIEKSLLPMNEKIYDNNATIENSLLPMNEKIGNKSNVKLIENICTTKKSEIPLIEKIVSDANSDLIAIKELVGIPDNTVINIKENIQMARDLNIIEKVFIKDSILLPITEGITTNNDSLIRILENVKNSSEDRLNIKEYIAITIGEEKLNIKEKITISDKIVINTIENIVIDGYSRIPIKENIVINGNDKIDINENIVEKAEEKIVLLEEVKILGNDTVSIIENVKPVSLTIVENIRREVDYATRLITFTKPTFTYKKGK